MIELSYTFGRHKYSISREAVVAAMRTFDRKFQEIRPTRRGSKYFVWWRGKPYPPKDILRSLPIGVKGPFTGGEATNQVFRDLEFHVGKGDLPEHLAGVAASVPSIRTLKRNLFAKRWAPFTSTYLSELRKTGRYPGVYLLAFSDDRLARKRVELRDIFYVGLSCTGLSTRLNQFLKGKDEYCCHSAAMRFYKRWRPRSSPGQQFYVASVTISCDHRKEFRTELDLRKMGRAAELEYAVLAHIKKHTLFEPLLNRK
jgi:hypothetical protein